MNSLLQTILVVVFALAASNDALTCPKGWKVFNNACYSYYATPYYWKDARDFCLGLDADLASVTSAAENEFVYKLTASTEAWIGGHSSAYGGYFRWVDGSKYQYTNWGSGKPYISTYQCLATGFRNGPYWSNEYCLTKRPYICKYDSRTAYTLSGCPKGWARSQGKCFHKFQLLLNWADSRRYCKAIGGDLAVVDSKQKNTEAWNLASPYTAYVGASSPSGNLHFQWVNGKDINGYTNWFTGQPLVALQKCMTIGYALKEQWAGSYCTTPRPFVCERTATGPVKVLNYCPNGFQKRGGNCYRYFSKARNWHNAREQCLLRGTDLVKITNAKENEEVSKMSAPVSTWLGAKANYGGRLYYWPDQTKMTYANWYSIYPVSTGLQCIMNNFLTTNAWVNVGCGGLHPFVCQAKVVPNAPQICPDGWNRFNDKCYRFFNKLKNFQQARGLCQGEGADLATIKNPFQNEDLWTMVAPHHTWLGARGTMTNFKWLDNSKFKYTRWRKLYPLVPSYHCLTIGLGGQDTWTNYICVGVAYVLCEKKAQNTNIIETIKPVAPKPPKKEIIINNKVKPATNNNKCSSGWKKVGNTCIRFINGLTKTWENARKFCQALGGDLISIHSTAENNEVFDQAKPNTAYIGGNRPSISAIFSWIDGTKWDFNSFNTVSNKNGPCLVMNGEVERWDANKCNAKLPFVCEVAVGTAVPEIIIKKPVQPPKPIIITPTAAPYKLKKRTECPKPFNLFEGRCYYALKKLVTWNGGANGCAGKGGFMASITSAKEDKSLANFISKYINSPAAWVGGYVPVRDRSKGWQWTDGSTFDYKNWASGMPQGEYHDCIAVDAQGEFSNHHCDSDQKPAVCYTDPITFSA